MPPKSHSPTRPRLPQEEFSQLLLLMPFAAACGLAFGAPKAAPAAAPPAKLIPLKVAYDGYSMTTAPMNYAVEKGIFRKYGLDVTLAYIDGGSTLSQAVVGGSINIAQNG